MPSTLRAVLTRLSMVASLVVGVAVIPGCSEERAPVNRVQPNALSKTFFVGDGKSTPPEFYMRTTVVDVAAGAGSDGLFTNSDAQPTVRVRFEITEQLLLARLTYELIDHTDGKGAQRTNNGQIVAAYAIQSHFDIKRDYNPATGEQSNVIVENTTDRAWNDRAYFRVDWSKNLITDAYDLDTVSQLGIDSGVKFDPVAYYVNDPANPDTPVFDVKNGYFDITSKVYASPQIIHDPDYGDFPACYLIGQYPIANCNPSEVTLRESFRQVVSTDYEPMEITGKEMDMFGFFTDDRYGYDRRYGVVDDQWRRFVSRWNIFNKSHDDRHVACNTPDTTPVGADPHRDMDHNGTEDECEAVGGGSRCDSVVGECTIPYRQRTIKTIPWYANADSPPDLFDGSKAALDAWNQSMRVAVIAGRLAECRRTGDANCEQTMGWPSRWSDDYNPPVGSSTPNQVPNIFVFCHNPVDPSVDDPACGAKGLSPRVGDLRYNIVNIVPGVQLNSPWGIMVNADDPLTGETLMGSVNEWAYVLDRAASTVTDVVALLNGEIAPDQFIKGQNVSEWVDANRPGGKAEIPAAMSAKELDSRMGAFDPKQMTAYWSGVPAQNAKLPTPARHQARERALIDSGKLGPGNSALSARLRQLRGTPIEAELASPEMVQAAGFDPTAPPSADAITRASPFGRMNPTLRRAEDKARLLGQSNRHACKMDEPEPDYLLGLAKTVQKMFPEPDPTDPAAVNKHRTDVWNWVRQETSKGVLAHEMGHAMGLRHNFEGSFDSLNYPLPYWQLRTKNGTVTQECQAGETSGENCIGPRWKDPLTQEEIDGNMNRWSTTSVMDYPGDNNQDMLTAGTYDRAALRFGYGGTVDVWAEKDLSVKSTSAQQKSKAYELTGFTTNPGLFGIFSFPDTNPQQNGYKYHHYSTYQKLYGLLGDCSASSDPDAIMGMKCNGAPMDVVDYRDMQDFAIDPAFKAYDWDVDAHAVDSAGRVRRGYLFSSDEFADTGNVPCFRNDAGADAYEQIRFLEGAYENRYIFDGFRRNRVMFNSMDQESRIQARYLDNIQLIAKAFEFGAVLDGDPLAPSATFNDDGNYGALSVGSSVAFDMFARIMTRGEPGYYGPTDTYGGYKPVGVSGTVDAADTAPLPGVNQYDFKIGLGDGRYLHNDYDYSQGYFWSDYQTQVGTYYEKIWSIYYMAEAFDSFISNSKEDFTDSRYKNVNFGTVYPNQMRRLFANLMTNDYETYAPWVTLSSGGKPGQVALGQLNYPAWHDANDVGTRPAGGFIVEPNYGWNTQLYGMVWGTMFFTTNWSQAFIDDARIVVKDSDGVSWPTGETYAFYDPESGMRYRAHTVGMETVMGAQHQKGTAARMLEWANHVESYAYDVVHDANGNPQVNADGSLVFQLDANGKPAVSGDATAMSELKKYVASLDSFRQLTATFEQDLTDLPMP